MAPIGCTTRCGGLTDATSHVKESKMLKPSDVNTTAPINYSQAQLDALETQFDEAITMASTSGQWPAQVAQWRDNMSQEAVNEMCRRYTDLGWIATPGRGPVRAVINRK